MNWKNLFKSKRKSDVQIDDSLLVLEKKAFNYGRTSLIKENISKYPEMFRKIHSYKVFGESILSIPAELIIEGDEEEFEIPFKFVDDNEILDVYRGEFQPEIGENFIQIGSFYDVNSELILLDVKRNTVHNIHIADIIDKSSVEYMINNEISSLNDFIQSLRRQTCTCLMNPTKLSDWKMIEVRNTNELRYEDDKKLQIKVSDDVWSEYLQFIEKHLKNGYEIHYAPKSIIDRLKK